MKKIIKWCSIWIFAITREASKRTLNMRPYDVQLIGAMVLHDGRIAEMKTGEGKTLVGSLAVSLNALQEKCSCCYCKWLSS